MFCLQKCAAIYGLGHAMARVDETRAEHSATSHNAVAAVETQRNHAASLLVDATDRIDELEAAFGQPEYLELREEVFRLANMGGKLVMAVPDVAGRLDIPTFEPECPHGVSMAGGFGCVDCDPPMVASLSRCLRCGESLSFDSTAGEALGPLCLTCDNDEMIKPTGTRRVEG